jgi:hypothetical protein
VAGKAHFGGKCIDAGCVDGLRVPVKMVVGFHSSFGHTYIALRAKAHFRNETIGQIKGAYSVIQSLIGIERSQNRGPLPRLLGHSSVTSIHKNRFSVFSIPTQSGKVVHLDMYRDFESQEFYPPYSRERFAIQGAGLGMLYVYGAKMPKTTSVANDAIVIKTGLLEACREKFNLTVETSILTLHLLTLSNGPISLI